MSREDVRMVPVGRGRVGLVGLDKVLEEFAAAGREPSEDLGVELVRRVAQRNYVPPAAAGEYARALVAEYRRYLGEAVPEERVGISIRILGSGCPQCEHLTSTVLSALAALDVAADVEHVTDPRAIAEYGVLGTPALVINGTVKVVGRVPTVAEIKAWLAR